MPDEYIDYLRESEAMDREAEHNWQSELRAAHNSTDWAAPRTRAARPFDEAASEARHANRQAAAARTRAQVRAALEEHGRQRTLSLFSQEQTQ